MSDDPKKRYWLYDQSYDAWFFYSSEYEVWPTLFEMVNAQSLLTILIPVLKLYRIDLKIFGGDRWNSDITPVQARAAHLWAERNRIFEKADQGIHRIDMVPDVTDF